MKSVVKQYPAVLLFSFLVYSSFIGHSVATSIVVIALAALSAYRAYLDKLEVQDPSIVLKNEIDLLKNRLDLRENEVKSIKDDFAKIALSSSKGFINGQAVRF